MTSVPSRKLSSGYKLVFGYLGIFMALIGIMNLLPLLVIPFLKYLPGGTALDHASVWYMFFIPGVSAIIIGLVLYFVLLFNHEKGIIKKDQDAVLLLLVWASAIFVSSIPFACTKEFTFLAGMFEAISGLSTCGYTIFGKATLDPNLFTGYHLFMIHRSMLHLFGGAGLVLIIASVISGKAGVSLYQSEGHSDKLLPSLKRTARLILTLYLIYILFGIILFCACGMSLFDAINHSISAVATGGFSTHYESIAYYSSDAFINGTIKFGGHATFNGAGIVIEIVSLVLMLLGSTNFLLVFKFFTGKFKEFFKDIEIAVGSIFLFIGIIIYSIILKTEVSGIVDGKLISLSWFEAFRYGIYTFISMMTTTGLNNIPALINPLFFNIMLGGAGFVVMFIAVIVGNGHESTSGGIKQFRIATIFCSFYWNIKKRLRHKNKIVSHQFYHIDRYQEVTDVEILDTYTFVGIYITLLLLPAFIICWICNNRTDLSWFDMSGGNPICKIIYEFGGCLGCTGFSCGILTYSDPNINPVIMIFYILAMLLGRLEIMPLFVGIVRGVKDANAGLKKLFSKKVEEIDYVN